MSSEMGSLIFSEESLRLSRLAVFFFSLRQIAQRLFTKFSRDFLVYVARLTVICSPSVVISPASCELPTASSIDVSRVDD